MNRGMKADSAGLNFIANSAHKFRGLGMKLDTSGSTRRGRILPVCLICFLALGSHLLAQQPANTTQEQPVTPAQLPSVQPASEAATSASGAVANAPKTDEAKATSDWSSIMKL